ncbi:cation:proton antiporter [Gulosibacter molinativorax]|uniref:Sodium:proton antiporter n=1 Tax=Gulosibacter molinativorax TaxID=256821 RepID=A0ABT7C8M5_9MICO|nr:sodium:proton antiporter [Gulosibacter molinativorax]MDJ1371553.1 sodium:proton antiporter [Gulosibacter molinativorax]QUY62496.1 Sodium, potassium, lithium and rubidium/H(+) antiporter [Gulosibacter molinativorax]
MIELLVGLVLGLLVIAASTLIGPKFGVASPLLLVLVGVAASFLPLFNNFEVNPELVLQGILPPLLYSSAVSMPTMNFRREFGAISGLSVFLVVGSALALGLFFMLVVPGLGFAWGVALGAIVSPTDAVATSIVKRTAASKRVVSILDGESLLNDATALVLLRTAIVATAASFSFWGTIGTFTYSVIIAILIGAAVGFLNLQIRKRISDSTVNTVISFAVPFAASLPTELLGGSGLVAAVVAGLITGVRAARTFTPQNRISDAHNWRTIELVLEGTVFLTMGLEMTAIIEDVTRGLGGIGIALWVSLGALALIILVRAAFVAPLLWILAMRRRRLERLLPHIRGFGDQLKDPEGRERARHRLAQRGLPLSDSGLNHYSRRVIRSVADIQYFLRDPLGWREGTILVWAGMRGAVTVAAAQTLPSDTPQRTLLILIAFAVALLSLLIQGGTIGPLVRMISPRVDRESVEAESRAERMRLLEVMREGADAVPEPQLPNTATREQRLATTKRYHLAKLRAERRALLKARDHGTFDADVLEDALANLDASQIALEMRGPHDG